MKSLITEPLGLYGWKKAEPVLLAALLSEEPLLLVGAHGCAKSFVLERLAESLGRTFRAYNASLINYDDLVGVPLPDATRTKLEYLSSPESIWDAEVVFIDEISRTRPELQNKLFPIIYDRRVQGRPLTRLVYRWAAMNPPPTDEDLDDGNADYIGSEPLDAALADRFPYIVSVPEWDDLSSADQGKILADQFAGRHEFPVDIRKLVAEARARYEALLPDLASRLTPYVITLVAKLHAAHAELTAICKAVWELAALDASDPLVQLMRITDPVLRLRTLIAKRLAVPPDRVAVVIGEGVASARRSASTRWASRTRFRPKSCRRRTGSRSARRSPTFASHRCPAERVCCLATSSA